MRAAKASIGLFCSAADGLSSTAMEAAERFGAGVARADCRLIYGGGGRGLMGLAARAAMAAGGEVIGIMPALLAEREQAAIDITELRIVPSMAIRKELMIELSDVFVALPGGVGTLDEVLEAITTFDLRLHDKPTVLCNIDRFWDPFEDLIRSMRGYGVLRERMAQSYLVVPDVEASLGAALDKVEGLASAMLPVG